MAFPTHNIFRDAGFDVKGLYGHGGTTIQIGKVHEGLSSGRGAEAFLSHLDGTGLMIYSNGLTFI